MKRLATALLAVGLAAALCPAQTGEPPSGRAAAPVLSPEALVKQLGSDDYAVRAAASKQLRDLGEAGRAALEEGCRSESLEISTRAQLLLDELDTRREEAPPKSRAERARGGRLTPEPPRPGEAPPLPQRFRELDELMERLRGQLGAGQSGGPAIEELMREMNRPFFQVDSGSRSSSTRIIRGDEILEMERRPDGSVSFSVSPTPRPGVQSREPVVYEAPSLSEFRARHPEVYARYRDSGLFEERRNGFSIVLGGRGLELPLVVMDDPLELEPAPGGGVLQVVVEPVPELLRAHVAAIPARALLVSEVTPDGPGFRLGLRPFDVITRIDGRAVQDAAAVRRILADPELSEKATITIDIVRGGVARQLTGPRP